MNRELEVMDMYCAAFLHTTGVRLLRLAPSANGRFSFIFADDGSASRCLGEWRQKRAFCDVRAYAESLRLTKRLLMTNFNARQTGAHGEDDYDNATQSTATQSTATIR